jgi:hypothetical protein
MAGRAFFSGFESFYRFDLPHFFAVGRIFGLTTKLSTRIYRSGGAPARHSRWRLISFLELGCPDA